MTIVARDPGVRRQGAVLLARVEVPRETLTPGPRGHRVQVVDVDASSGQVFRPWPHPDGDDPYARWLEDPALDRARLLGDPQFHQWNAYAVAMRVLALFERALGRRVGWGFKGHQLRIAPHAFADANAYYSREHQALLFGWFQGRSGRVFTCLSHDIVAHETTHAIVDGLRPWYLDPSSPDQAAFHEAFADLAAILSVFSLPEVAAALLDETGSGARVAEAAVTPEALRRSVLLAVGSQLGDEMLGRGEVLRRSATLAPDPGLLARAESQEPHRRGEVLVAAALDAFVSTWSGRLGAIADRKTGTVSRERVVEEGARAADRLLQGAIRALDYAPPVDLMFGDFLSALVTADREIHPGDEPFRALLLTRFAAFGIAPAVAGGYWEPWRAHTVRDGIHLESLQREPLEVFRFLWENRAALGVDPAAWTQVTWVRPCVRVASDGFVLRETVAEYVQQLDLRADELPAAVRPAGVPADTQVKLSGGGTLVFDEFGSLKFHVQNRVVSPRQKERLEYLWQAAGVGDRETLRRGLSFSDLHRRRLAGTDGAMPGRVALGPLR
jgi:hypothetical protein